MIKFIYLYLAIAQHIAYNLNDTTLNTYNYNGRIINATSTNYYSSNQKVSSYESNSTINDIFSVQATSDLMFATKPTNVIYNSINSNTNTNTVLTYNKENMTSETNANMYNTISEILDKDNSDYSTSHTSNSSKIGSNTTSVESTSNAKLPHYHMMFMNAYAYDGPTCDSGNYQFPIDVVYGIHTKSAASDAGWVIADMITDLKRVHEQNKDYLVGYVSRGSWQCASWIGNMISGGDTMRNLEGLMRNNLNNVGISKSKYFEYVDTANRDPAKTFGVYCITDGDKSHLAKVIRGWSKAVRAADSVGDLNVQGVFNKPTLCSIDYSKWKRTGGMSSMSGMCDFVYIESGQTGSSACNIQGDSVTLYNPGVNFNSLRVGQAICCSIGDGNRPKDLSRNMCSGDNFYKEVAIEHGEDSIGSESNVGWLVADMVGDLTDTMKAWSNDYVDFVQRGSWYCGSWVGAMVSNTDTFKLISESMRDVLQHQRLTNGRYFEYIDSSGNPMKSFGLYCVIDGNKDIVAKVVRGWSMNKRARDSNGFLRQGNYINGKGICYINYNKRKSGNASPKSELKTCEYKRIQSGQTPGDVCLSSNVPSDSVSVYNKHLQLNLVFEGTPICCSYGPAPDLRPKQNSDGSCFVHEFKKDESCSAVVSQYYPLTINDLNNYNKDTFGWYGCDDGHPWLGDKICLSSGTPPRPSVNPLAECGPQAPGDKYMASCPLNACCSEFGFCGYGPEFCNSKSSKTNAPGTTGCLSNCGKGRFKGEQQNQRRVGYWIGSDVNGGKPVDVLAADHQFDIIHMGFADISDDHKSISVDKIKDEYTKFQYLTHAKKVISFGGWDFSTESSTYHIFRDAIGKDAENFAQTIVDFLHSDENSWLDGVDFDWEYPGAPDIPGIPADDVKNGENLRNFLSILRSKLDSRYSISLAFPSSFWYLKPYPIKEIIDIVDYGIMMTYDLYGQWTYDQKWSGGPYTKCHTDLQETENSLNMIAKSGADTSKILLGIANYARGYKTEQWCTSMGCKFLGPDSQADGGIYLNVPGILSTDELNYIKRSGKYHYQQNYDKDSDCLMLTYGNNQWAAWTNDNSARINYYKSKGFGGVSLWAINYDTGVLDGTHDIPDDLELLYYPDKYAIVEYDAFSVNSNLNNLYCWNKYRKINEYEQLSDIDEECVNAAVLAYYVNNATAAVNHISDIIHNIKGAGDQYQEDLKGYSVFFSKYLAYKYEGWIVRNMKNNSDWFDCFDENGNMVKCNTDEANTKTNVCGNNCCPGIGCYHNYRVYDADKTNEICSNKNAKEYYCCPANEQTKNILGVPLSFTFASNEGESVDVYVDDTIVENTKFMQENNILEMMYPDTEYQDSTNLRKRGKNENDENYDIIEKEYETDHQYNGMKLNSEEAYKSLSEYTGYTMNSSIFYIQPFHRFQHILENDKKGICYTDIKKIQVKCMTMPYDKLLLYDPLQHITPEYLNNITTLLEHIIDSVENESDYISTILQASYPTLNNIIDLSNNVKTIQDIGREYEFRCKRLKIMLILKPFLILIQIIAAIVSFWNPLVGVAIGAVGTAIETGLNPDITPTDIGLAILGTAFDFGGLGKLGKIGKFSKLVKPVSNKVYKESIYNSIQKTISKYKGCTI